MAVLESYGLSGWSLSQSLKLDVTKRTDTPPSPPHLLPSAFFQVLWQFTSTHLYSWGGESLVRLFWLGHKLFLACGMRLGERSARGPALFLPDLWQTFSRLVSNLPVVGETRACSANNEDLVWNPNLSTRSPALDHWVSHTFFGIPVILTLY